MSTAVPLVLVKNARPCDDELRQLYATERLSLRRIAERFKVSAQAVHGWVAAADIERRPPGGVAPDLEIDELVEQYLGGRSGLELARRYRCSPATVYRRLDDAGIDRRRSTPSVARDTLTAALAVGLSAPAMAAQFDVSVTAVCRALRREGLQTATQARRSRSAERRATLQAELERTTSSH